MSKTVLITGASSGIGLSLASKYKARGDRVLAVCRQSNGELNALDVEVINGIDVTQSGGLERLINFLDGTAVDVLINNAGVFRNETLDHMDLESVEYQLQVNAIGPLRITHGLLHCLFAGSKVVMITSRMGSITDNGSGAYYGYRMSKAALNAAAKSLSIDLAPRDIAVAIIHPGFVQTRMVGYAGDISADTAAERIVSRIGELNLDNSGTFWHSDGSVLDW